MEGKNQNNGKIADRQIVIERIINAPRKLVFEAWTDPKHLEQWWGPNGFSTTTREFDFKAGGVWRHVMHGPDGTDYPNEIIYEEIVRPERITYTHGGGEDGPDDAQFYAEITFEDLGNQTKLTMRSTFATPAERDHVVRIYGAIEGGKQTLGRLDDYVASMN
ncbi:MAG: SRPBCC family protein [Bacteroidota bacterium]|nr:SRPBCC family protein [Bacteroidota bacterium]MDP4231140.1 SRPBCC family protein [Bacteroidota bacterium]MDP4235551.1 SRPBCC family protein [Bacteroidota bacterium]